MRPAALPSRWILTFLACSAIAAALVGAAPTQAVANIGNDGSTPERAAVSCWDIKQSQPDSKDGRYWLLTPQLEAPTRFYCDMTTDGGGWVLVGRGRDDWSVAYNGRGTPEDVSEPVSGTAAFSPRQLDSNVINALFGGKRLDEISPELRVRRAANAAGTTWQEVNMTVAKAQRWTWSLLSAVPLSRVTFDGSRGITKTTTRDIMIDDGTRRLITLPVRDNGWASGMNYGRRVAGTTGASSYLYSKSGSYATPFAQMFIRPKLRAADVSFESIPDSGTAESTVPAVPKNGTKPQTWGVSGTGQGGEGENGTEVQAFAQIGSRMFAGGNFTQIRKGQDATGSDVIDQPYLAAFDATSGDYVPGFKPPLLNGQVKALEVLPGNRLAVGGEFTRVGLEPRAGFVVLDATTGAVDEQWTYSIENRLSGGTVSIRALDAAGDYLYFGGAMTHFSNGTKTSYAKGAGRVKISTKTPDWNWTPDFNGTVTAQDVSPDKSRIYYAGYFTTAQDAEAQKMAAFTTDGSRAVRFAADRWIPQFSSTGSRYQQAIKAVGSKVWVGGAQHSMFSYNSESFAVENTSLALMGGDLQAIDARDGFVFGGCHCENAVFDGWSDYDEVVKSGRYQLTYENGLIGDTIDSIHFVGAWDAKTGRYAPDFSAKMKARRGHGIWAIKVADDGTVWTGGSLTTAVSESGRNQWVGGMARFAIRDHEAPDVPSAVTASVADGTAKVSWSGSAGAARYEVLRNDRAVAVTSSTTATIPDSRSGDRFFVRAVDTAGNRSASTKLVSASESTVLLNMGQSWKYYASSNAVPASWAAVDFDDAGWTSAPAPIGWGSTRIKTTLTPPEGQKRPVATYYRTSFDMPAGVTYRDVKVTTVADDGAAVYINGTEVGRSNLPTEGTPTGSTYATAAPRSQAAWDNKVTYAIPAKLLREGKNIIAISSHVMWRATPDGSVDAEITATN